MGWGFIDRIGEKLRQMKHGGTIRPIFMPTGMPIIANSIRGIPTSIPQVDRIGSFKDGGIPIYDGGKSWMELKNSISDNPGFFKDGGVPIYDGGRSYMELKKGISPGVFKEGGVSGFWGGYNGEYNNIPGASFLDGSVVQSRVPMLAPRPQIFNLRI